MGQSKATTRPRIRGLRVARPLLCLLLVATAPVAAAEPEVLAVIADQSIPVGLDNAAITSLAGSGPCTSGGTMTAASNRLQFSETALENGCSTASVLVNLPATASSRFLSFEANRIVTPGIVARDPAFRQDVRADGGQLLVSDSYFDETDGASGRFTGFSYNVSGTPSPLRVTFEFGDRAADVDSSLPLRGHANSAGIQNVAVLLPALELPTPQAVLERNETVDLVRTEHWSVALNLAPGTGYSQLKILLGQDVDNAHLVGPGVNASMAELSLVLRQGVWTWGYDGLTPPGQYTFTFTTQTLLPLPPPPEPVRNTWFVFVALGTPLLAAAVAVVPLFDYHNLGRAARTQNVIVRYWPSVAVFLATYAWYLVTLVFALFLGTARLSVLPPTGGALATILSLAAATIAFLLIGILVGMVARPALLGRLAEHRHAQELEGANMELERSNEDLQQFAYLASHDLKEPLRAVTINLEILEEDHAKQLPTPAKRLITVAKERAHGMRELIDGVMRLASTQSLQRTRADVRAIVESCVADLAPAIDATNASVTLGKLPSTLNADPEALAHVFRNLISNAIKYHRPGTRPRIQVQFEAPWTFIVKDNGMGIPAERQEQAFKPFRRVHSKTDGQGVGIGLALCKRIIEWHGGHITMDSTVNKGTTLTFTIPPGDPS